MFHYTVESALDIEGSIAALEASLKEEQFGILWRFNIQDKLKEKGFAFERDFVVLEVCNPAEANRVLNQNAMAGYFMPCKIVVYEQDGKTRIGMPKPAAFMDLLEDDELKPIAADVEERLIRCIDRAVNMS